MATRQVILKLRGGSEDINVDSAVLDTLDWGNGIEDSVRLLGVDGAIVQFNWTGVLFVRESNVPPEPPSDPPIPFPLPNWLVRIHFTEQSGAGDFVVTEAVKDQLLVDLAGPGSEDTILTFDTLSSYRMRLPSKALAVTRFKLQP